MKKKRFRCAVVSLLGEMMPKKRVGTYFVTLKVLHKSTTGKVNDRGAYVTLEPTLVEKAWKNRLFEKTIRN